MHKAMRELAAKVTRMAKRAAGAAAASTRLSANTAAAAVAATAGAVALVWLRGQKVGCPCGLSWPTEVTPAASSFEYGGGCDFEVVDEMPSQQEFDARFWNRAPLLVRNGTRDWPARTRWTKEALWRRSQRERHSAGYFRTDDHWASYTSVGNRSMRAERGDVDMAEFLCHGVCQPPVQTDQVYLFDRDDWRTGLPGLDEDVQFPSTIARHFDAAWHERWSLYFLISALGSGINFHQHTNAFNGLLFGRKRWFLYPDGHAPPSFKLGMLAWFRDVYRAEWGGSVQWEGTPRRATRGLLQCMQAAGDLIYIPQQMWHATIALGPGVGVSGQV